MELCSRNGSNDRHQRAHDASNQKRPKPQQKLAFHDYLCPNWPQPSDRLKSRGSTRLPRCSRRGRRRAAWARARRSGLGSSRWTRGEDMAGRRRVNLIDDYQDSTRLKAVRRIFDREVSIPRQSRGL